MRAALASTLLCGLLACGDSGGGDAAGRTSGSGGGVSTAGSGGSGAGGASDSGGSGGVANVGGASAGGSGGAGASGSGGASAAGGSGGRGSGGGGGAGGAPDAGGVDAAVSAGPLGCPPLPAASGNVIRVTPDEASSLDAIVASADSGDTIALEDGTYVIPRLSFATPGVTLRSVSDDASKVILDGQYAVGETLYITADDVTIAHVTVQRAFYHPIHLTAPDGDDDTTGTLIYGVRLVDGSQQFLKINANGAQTAFVDDGRVECSSFLMTADGRDNVDTTGGPCYTGGIDAHAARGWVVRQNHFEGIYCDGMGLAEHAIHFWRGSRDTLVENNVIVSCARGIGFGLQDGSSRTYADAPYGGLDLSHYDGIIRNNVVYADIDWYDTGIELQNTREPTVVHNTVLSTAGSSFFSSIDYRWPQTRVVLTNNLARRITARDGAEASLTTNIPTDPDDSDGASPDWLLDAAGGDYHLAATSTRAIDTGTDLGDLAGTDLDGDAHAAGTPDIGADAL